MDFIVMTIKCPMCGNEHSVKVGSNDLKAWHKGDKYITDAFPYLNDTEREQLISHCCPDCQVILFDDFDEIIE